VSCQHVGGVADSTGVLGGEVEFEFAPGDGRGVEIHGRYT